MAKDCNWFLNFSISGWVGAVELAISLLVTGGVGDFPFISRGSSFSAAFCFLVNPFKSLHPSLTFRAKSGGREGFASARSNRSGGKIGFPRSSFLLRKARLVLRVCRTSSPHAIRDSQLQLGTPKGSEWLS